MMPQESFSGFLRFEPEKPGRRKMAGLLERTTRCSGLSGFSGFSGIYGLLRSNV
jgi:hypothetical protein